MPTMNQGEREGFEGLSHEVTTLSQRVGTIETGLQTLVTSDASNQQTLGRVVEGLAGLSKTVDDLSGKLDQARTKKPELSAVASVVAVIITIGTLALMPAYVSIEKQDRFDRQVSQTHVENAATMARSTTRLDHVEGEISDIEKRLLEVEKSRFTADDGRQLENRLRQ